MAEDKYTCANPQCRQSLPRREFHENPRARGRRPVTSRCRRCRREDRYRRLYPDTTCEACLHHRPLDPNRRCSGCNALSGLRACRGCQRLLARWWSFKSRDRLCKDCKKG